MTTDRRSAQTMIRHLRHLLRTSAQQMVLVTAFEFGGKHSPGLDGQRDCLKAIERELSPKRRP